MKKNVLLSKIRSLSGTKLRGVSLRFLFLDGSPLGIPLDSMAWIPLLSVMTRLGVNLMSGLDVLRSGAGVEEDVGGLPAEKVWFISGVGIS